MTDHIFSATLTFALLAAGTLAVGSEFIGSTRPAAQRQQVEVVHLPTVQIVGKKIRFETEVAGAESTEPKVRQLQ